MPVGVVGCENWTTLNLLLGVTEKIGQHLRQHASATLICSSFNGLGLV